MEVKKIVLIGNSVALRNRPHRTNISKNYGQILQEKLNLSNEKLVLAENLAFGRATIYDLHKVYNQMINAFGDLYIINLGVSDAATREMPLWFADVLNSKKISFKKNLFNFFFLYFIKPIRRQLVLLRGKRSWTSHKLFKRHYEKLIYTIQHNTSGKIICLSLNLPDERIENIVPGSRKRYIEFNEIIKAICKQKNAIYLDLDYLNSEVHYPDGTHLSEEGNKAVAKMILHLIKREKLI